MAREEFEGIDRFVRGAALEETNGLVSSETKCFSVEMVEKFFKKFQIFWSEKGNVEFISGSISVRK